MKRFRNVVRGITNQILPVRDQIKPWWSLVYRYGVQIWIFLTWYSKTSWLILFEHLPCTGLIHIRMTRLLLQRSSIDEIDPVLFWLDSPKSFSAMKVLDLYGKTERFWTETPASAWVYGAFPSSLLLRKIARYRFYTKIMIRLLYQRAPNTLHRIL